jgi:hypothetical protein
LPLGPRLRSHGHRDPLRPPAGRVRRSQLYLRALRQVGLRPPRGAAAFASARSRTSCGS